MNEPLDESLRPSSEVAEALRAVGWRSGAVGEVSEWVERLRDDGNKVSPVAEAILRNYGGLLLRRQSLGGPSFEDIEINPSYWYDERDRVSRIEATLSASLCPVGETSGAAMLAVLEDGRVISEYEGCVDLIGHDWRHALDYLVLGRGAAVALAQDFEPLSSERPHGDG
jgi:hypothetical protein